MNINPVISYYGRLDGPLLGDNLGSSIVDDTFKRIIEKNNEIISKQQCELHKELNKSVYELISAIKSSVDKIIKRLEHINIHIDSKMDKLNPVKKEKKKEDETT